MAPPPPKATSPPILLVSRLRYLMDWPADTSLLAAHAPGPILSVPTGASSMTRHPSSPRELPRAESPTMIVATVVLSSDLSPHTRAALPALLSLVLSGIGDRGGVYARATARADRCAHPARRDR